MKQEQYLGILHQGALQFPMTDIWMDSCGEEELNYGLERGIVGATSNPTIVCGVIKSELRTWEKRINEMMAEMPTLGEEEIAWKLIYEICALRAKKLMPIFEAHKGKKGRLSLQTNIMNYRSAEKMLEQALEIDELAPNMQVKMPANEAGIAAMEEATFRGISINATVSFTVAQAVAVAEAVERGLARRKKADLPTDTMAPVCTLMIGRTDDWMKVCAAKWGQAVAPEALEWAGIAVIKHAYELYNKRGYTTRLLSAANRNIYHWSQLLGGDLAQTINYGWQQRLNSCDAPVVSSMGEAVEERWMSELKKLDEFHKSYEEDGMTVAEFSSYGAFRLTLASFLEGTDELYKIVRKYMV